MAKKKPSIPDYAASTRAARKRYASATNCHHGGCKKKPRYKFVLKGGVPFVIGSCKKHLKEVK